jgi:hypothetical protein
MVVLGGVCLLAAAFLAARVVEHIPDNIVAGPTEDVGFVAA